MSDTVLALDFGIYTWPLSVAQLQEAKALGYEAAIIGLWHGQSANRYAEEQIRSVLTVGLRDGYYSLIAPLSWTPLRASEQIMAGCDKTGALDVYPLNLLAVDCEIDITPDMIVEALQEAEEWAPGRTCIYTGAWWWNWFILRYHDWFYEHPGAFADEPAWLADYDWQPVLDTPRLAHLGLVVGKQFKGSTSEVAGINADLNVFDQGWLFGEEDDMDEATVKGIVDKALKPVLRSLELQAEVQDIRASLEDWMATYGEELEPLMFMAFIDKHIAWRLRGKPGWTVPA